MSNRESGREQEADVGRPVNRQWFREEWTPADVGEFYRVGVRHGSELSRKWAQFAARVIHGYE